MEQLIKKSYDGDQQIKYLLDRCEIWFQSGCWHWTKATDCDGYGLTSSKIHPRAHRMSYNAFVGNIPDDHFICHRCDIPGCINPNHLFLGTSQNNVDDMIRKKRKAIGSRNGNAKLTEEQVCEIRKRYIPRQVTQTQLAKEYGVDPTLISHILLYKIWKNI